MEMYATAECATCHAIMPKSEMREVAVKRLSSTSRWSSSGSSAGQSRRSSFSSDGDARFGNSSSGRSGRRTTTHHNMRIERLWVCDGCPAPASDLDPGTRMTIIVGIILLLAWGYSWLTDSGSTQPAPAAAAAASTGDQPLAGHEPAEAALSEAPAEPDATAGSVAEIEAPSSEAVAAELPGEIPAVIDESNVNAVRAAAFADADRQRREADQEAVRLEADYQAQMEEYQRKAPQRR